MATKKSNGLGTDSEGETTFSGEQSSSMITSTFDTTSSRLNATRIEIERKQLNHSIQLLKLELSQKEMIIEAMKSDHSNTVDELEEKVADITCERNLLSQKLRAMTNVYEDELRELRQQRPIPVHICTLCQQRGEAAKQGTKSMDTLMEQLKTDIRKPILLNEEYEQWFGIDEGKMDFGQLARMRLYEASRPFIVEAEMSHKKLKDLQETLLETESRYDEMKNAFSQSKSEISQLKSQCDDLLHINETLSFKIKSNNYKSENFDIVKKERDDLQRELDIIRRTLVEKEITEKVREEENRKHQEELSLAQHSVALLKQDKEYLSKSSSDVNVRCRELEERNLILQDQLSNIKQSKEELYEEFIRTRQQQKEEYGHQLSEELESIRHKTNIEIERVRVQTKEMYERENRVLLESKERADVDRDKIGSKLTEMEEKYDTVMNEYRQLQLSSESTISDIQSQLQMKVFECERACLLHEETSKSLDILGRERNKLREKVECLKDDIRKLTNEKDAMYREYESSLRDKSQRLETYESLEHELDDVVMQAAEMENEQDAERVLFSFGFGTSVPSTSRRRMQQSVQLARRVLKLERINQSLRQQLESMDKEKKAFQAKITGLCSQLDMSQQPQRYLMESLHSRDNEISTVRNRNMALEARIRELERENKRLVDAKNQISLDLERLLSHGEELSVMKKAIKAIGDNNRGRGTCAVTGYEKINNTENISPHQATPLQPRPVVFTRKDDFSRLKSLKTSQRL